MTTDTKLLDLGYETNKLRLDRSNGRFLSYHYTGLMQMGNKELVPAFPNLVRYREGDDFFERIDAAQKEAMGLSITDILHGETSTNRLLYSAVIDAPEGIIASDPCNIKQVASIEAGTWEVAFKGFHGVSEGSNVEIESPWGREDNDPIISIEGFAVNKYLPEVSTIWVLKPGAKISTISDTPAFKADIDSGMVGLFPLHMNHDIAEWGRGNPFLDTARKDLTDPIYLVEGGMFANTIMGDLTCYGYSLYAEDGEKVGYVISTSSILPNEWDEDDEYVQEQEEGFAITMERIQKKYEGRGLSITSTTNAFDKDHVIGSIDGMKFSMDYDYHERGYLLRVGITDLDYRRKVEEGLVKRGITRNGQTPSIAWSESYPERKLFEARLPKTVAYGPELIGTLSELLSMERTPVAEGHQLFW